MPASKKSEERFCPLCGWFVGVDNMGKHKRSSLCSKRVTMKELGFDMADDGVKAKDISLALEAGVKGKSEYVGGCRVRRGDYVNFYPAWAIRACDFYKARAETYVIKQLQRGKEKCEADMVADALQKIGEP